MDYYYSPSINGFYPAPFPTPEDAILCPRERYLETYTPPVGKIRQPGPDGLPVLVDDPEHQLTISSLADAVAAKHTNISNWRDAQEAENLLFEHAGHRWDAGVKSKNRMEETLALANTMGSLPEPFFWTTANNIDVSMDLPSLQLLANAMATARGVRVFEIHARQRQMKAEVDALADIEAVKAYPVGWPDEAGA